MGRRLLRTYTVPPYAYWPPGYPLKQGTQTFCSNFVERAMKLQGRPDWQSRAGAIIAGEICGRGYDVISRQGWLPPGDPKWKPGKRRGQWIDLDTGTIHDYPIPDEPWPYPGPKQPSFPYPQQPAIPRLTQGFVPGPRQGKPPWFGQPSAGPGGQPNVPRGTQPPSQPAGQPPATPAGQGPNVPGPRNLGIYVGTQSQEGWNIPQKPIPGSPQSPSAPVPQPPSAYPGPKQPSPPSGGQPSGPSGGQPSGPAPAPPSGGTPSGPAPYTPQLPSPPRVKPGGGDIAPDPSGSPVIPVPSGEGVMLLPNPGFWINFFADLFGQTAIKAQKVGIQDFFTPIFREYVKQTGLPLRDQHFLQFDPEGVQRYTLSNPVYADLRSKFLAEVGPLARYITPNPGPGITERIVNQFVTNAAINGWGVNETVRLWSGVVDAAARAGK